MDAGLLLMAIVGFLSPEVNLRDAYASSCYPLPSIAKGHSTGASDTRLAKVEFLFADR